MAIAPLLDTESADWSDDLFGASWPRPALQLVPAADDDLPGDEDLPGDDETEPGSGAPVTPAAARVVPCVSAATGVRTGLDVAERRARRASVQRRRRAIALGTVAVGLVCGLALPFGVLGGSPTDLHPAARASVASGTVYVVHPGDTLWSIAARFDAGGNPRPLAVALAKETGSAVVVPGERIAIP